jgi:hypothetical protein
MAIKAILSAQIDDPLAWKQAHLPIGKAGLAIGIVDDHPDAAYISSRLGTAGLINKLLGHNDADANPTDDLSAEFERLRQHVNPGDLNALDKILKFIPEVPVAGIQSKIMHLMNEAEYDHLFADSNVCNKGCLLSWRAGWASGYLTALPLPYLGLTLLPRHFQRVVQFRLGLKTCPAIPEVSSPRDGPVRRPRRDLQAWVTHHSSPRPHAVRAKHHRQ